MKVGERKNQNGADSTGTGAPPRGVLRLRADKKMPAGGRARNRCIAEVAMSTDRVADTGQTIDTQS
ncbi:hypothetical protein [Burkholderia multivorans]|uniref:hypothetical protein n=1 Tax=Burkholderia multivorans TaxID=87883 RepID=UPI0015E3E619|nr:hypothetical protein [Burkholderia multivorans]MBU9259792.1 hypothetical protein [Burkholderia multivorans]